MRELPQIPQPEDPISFYEIDFPENISEDEEVELGLGELLEEHYTHIGMERMQKHGKAVIQTESEVSNDLLNQNVVIQDNTSQSSENLIKDQSDHVMESSSESPCPIVVTKDVEEAKPTSSLSV